MAASAATGMRGMRGMRGMPAIPGILRRVVRHSPLRRRDARYRHDLRSTVGRRESESLSLSLSLSLSFVEKRNRYEGEKERNKVAQTYALGAYLWFGRRQMFWAHTYGLGAYLWFGRRRMLWAHTFGLRADVCFGQIKVEIVAFFWRRRRNPPIGQRARDDARVARIVGRSRLRPPEVVVCVLPSCTEFDRVWLPEGTVSRPSPTELRPGFAPKNVFIGLSSTVRATFGSDRLESITSSIKKGKKQPLIGTNQAWSTVFAGNLVRNISIKAFLSVSPSSERKKNSKKRLVSGPRVHFEFLTPWDFRKWPFRVDNQLQKENTTNKNHRWLKPIRRSQLFSVETWLGTSKRFSQCRHLASSKRTQRSDSFPDHVFTLSFSVRANFGSERLEPITSSEKKRKPTKTVADWNQSGVVNHFGQKLGS